jgi:glyoxylase-like metal-dependent hydrolase (beta-lactamase superfamily II)
METDKDSYCFKIGNFECMAISDTKSPMELNRLFPAIKPQQMEQLLRKYNAPPGDIMEVMCLLIKTGERTILIDTGWGVGEQPNSGCLMPILRATGIQPREIDMVIITHGHPDHIGGNTDEKGRALFPNARYTMYRNEWDFWTSSPDLPQTAEEVKQKMHAYVRKNLIPLRDKFTLVDDKTEIVPGIKFVSAPGHSPYHCMLEISSSTERLLYVSDLMHHPIQVPCPDCYVFGDFNPKQAIRTRSANIRQAASTGSLIFACHFTFPGLGYIVRDGDVLVWQPVETKT